MGIKGLLPAIRGHERRVQLRDLYGLKVAVDGMVWLHRGIHTCCDTLCSGKPSANFVAFCMGRIKLLTSSGIQPVVVFDGSSLPAKMATEEKRERSRLQALRQAVELSNAGQHGSARPLFARAVDASPRLAALFMRELRRYSIPFFVSPFEADAQLGWLSRSGLVDAVLSEDSDCLPYRCHRVLFKLDKDGNAIEMTRPELFRYWGAGKLPLASPMQATSGTAATANIQSGTGTGAAAAAGLHSIASVLPRMDHSARLSKGRSSKPSMFQSSSSSSSSSSRDGDKIDLSGFSDSMFLDMCVLCGCDYIDSPKGIGAAAACRWVKRFRGATQRMLSRMRFDGILPPAAPRSGTYEDQFRRARMTFLHQTVVDPRTGRQVRCQPLPQSAEEAAQAAIRKAVPQADAGAGAGADTSMPAEKEPSSASSVTPSSSSSSWFPLGTWAHDPPTREQRRAAEEAHRTWVRVRDADPLGFLGSPMPLALSRVVASGDFDPVAGEWLHSRHEAGAGAGAGADAGHDAAMEALMEEIMDARVKAGVPLGASHGGAAAREQAGRSGPRGLLASFLSGAQRAVEKERLQLGTSASAAGGNKSGENRAGKDQDGGRAVAAAANARTSDRSSSSSSSASVSTAASALAGSGVLQRLRGKMQSRVQRGFAGLDGMRIAPLGAFRAGVQMKAARGAPQGLSAGSRSAIQAADSSARVGTRAGHFSRNDTSSVAGRSKHASGLEWGGEGLASAAEHEHDIGPRTAEERHVVGTETSRKYAVAHRDQPHAGAHLSARSAGSRSRAASLQSSAPAARTVASRYMHPGPTWTPAGRANEPGAGLQGTDLSGFAHHASATIGMQRTLAKEEEGRRTAPVLPLDLLRSSPLAVPSRAGSRVGPAARGSRQGGRRSGPGATVLAQFAYDPRGAGLRDPQQSGSYRAAVSGARDTGVGKPDPMPSRGPTVAPLSPIVPNVQRGGQGAGRDALGAGRAVQYTRRPFSILDTVGLPAGLRADAAASRKRSAVSEYEPRKRSRTDTGR